MSFVHTAFGRGQIVGEETVRGRKQYLVAGNGFKLWVDEADAQIHTGAADFDFEPAEDVNEENSTDLPYDPTPQFPAEGFSEEQTIQPNHELDAEERLSPADSLSFDSVGDREYPGPAEHLFARRTAAWPGHIREEHEDENRLWSPDYGPTDKWLDWGPPSEGPWSIQGATDRDRYRNKAYSESRDRGRAEHERRDATDDWDHYYGDAPEPYNERTDFENFLRGGSFAGLSDKYIDITADADHYNDPVQRFRDDPIREITRLGHSLSDVHDDDRMEHYAALVDSDPMLREAAWSDVRQKAQRIRREGKMDVHDIDNNQIYATVHGDHGDYDVMIVKGGLGGNSITQWTCTCDWGRHAFKRKVLHVGRLCSHGLAGWLEMQSQELSDAAKKHPYKKRADVIDDYKSFNDEYNDGHVDKATADNFISRPHQAGGIEPMEPEDVDKLYNYVEDNKTQPGRRNYEVPYTLDPDKAYKSAEVLRTTPHSLTPDLKFIPKGEDEHFVDVEEDERETTGPDQIVHFGSRTAGYEEDLPASMLRGPAALGRYRRYCDENDLDELEPQSLEWYIEDHQPNDDAIKRIKDFHWINGLPGDPDLRNAGRYADNVGGWAGDNGTIPNAEQTHPGWSSPTVFDGTSMGIGDIGDTAGNLPTVSPANTRFTGNYHYAGEELDPEPYRDFDGGGELLNELREESSTPLEEDFGSMRDRNDDVREIVEELREKGYDADQFVASRRTAASPGADVGLFMRWREEGPAQSYHPHDAADMFAEEYGLDDYELQDLHDWIDTTHGRHASYGVGNQGAGPGGAFGQPGGGNWADHPFAGSGPDPKFWYESSEDYVDAHERPRYEDVTDLGDDDIIKYTKDKPKQSKTAWMPGKHKRQKDRPLLPENYEEEDDAGRGITRLPSGEQAETLVVRRHHGSVDAEDPIENFYKSGAAEAIKSGGMSSGGGSFSDDAIAERANQFLMRTAGRNYSLAEQRELEDEEHHLGARNLDGLDLAGTHYISDL